MILKTVFLHCLTRLCGDDPPNKGVKASSGIGVKIKNGMGVKQWPGIYSMFNEALDNDRARGSYAMQQIQILYAVERELKEKNCSFDERKQIRQENSVPVLIALGQWMKQQYMEVPPKSSIAKALAYSIERWERLSVYTEDGMLNIDNNPVENSIRPVALGRKNYLFAGSHEAAQRSAMLYSLLGTCKMHGIEPYQWLRDVLEKISDHPINKISDMLPHRFNK